MPSVSCPPRAAAHDGQAAPPPARAGLGLCRRGGRVPAQAPPPAQAFCQDLLRRRAQRRVRGGLGGGSGAVPRRVSADRDGRAAAPHEEHHQVSIVDADLAGRVLARALSRGGDFAELFCEERRGFTLSIDESRIERPQSGSERGAGLRVIDGEVTRFAHVDGLAEDDLMRAADGLASALSGDPREPLALRAAEPPPLQEIEGAPASVPAQRKAAVLRELDERARAAGNEVAQASASYSEGRRRVAVFNSEGLE